MPASAATAEVTCPTVAASVTAVPLARLVILAPELFIPLVVVEPVMVAFLPTTKLPPLETVAPGVKKPGGAPAAIAAVICAGVRIGLPAPSIANTGPTPGRSEITDSRLPPASRTVATSSAEPGRVVPLGISVPGAPYDAGSPTCTVYPAGLETLSSRVSIAYEVVLTCWFWTFNVTLPSVVATTPPPVVLVSVCVPLPFVE